MITVSVRSPTLVVIIVIIIISITIPHVTLTSALSIHTPRTLLSHFSLHKVPLQHNDDGGPWCYAATVDPTRNTDQTTNDIRYNFLATQVWPSARRASHVLRRTVDPEWNWTVCEWGCGPALPSIVLACECGGTKSKVIATDVDRVALEMVERAAEEQGLDNLSTMIVDLTSSGEDLDALWDNGGGEGKEGCGRGKGRTLSGMDSVDLYVMSDVFENNAVAEGSARMTMRALERNPSSRVWTFAQSDRAQRDVYMRELERLGGARYAGGSLEWCVHDDLTPERAQCGTERLLLFDLDEVHVNYG